MGKAKMGKMSKFTMADCDTECKPWKHCIQIFKIVKEEPDVEFRCPITSRTN